MASLEDRILEKCPGSPPGKLTFREHLAAFIRYWGWHVAAAVWLVVGITIDYLHDHFSIVEGKYPKYASIIFGMIGLIRYYQRVAVMYPRDTRK